MPQYSETPLTYRTLFKSALMRVEDYRCHYERGGPGREECLDENQIVILRHGAFCQHFSRRQSVVADVNQAIFFSEGTAYRVSHPGDCGDQGTLLTPAPTVLRELLNIYAPTVADCPQFSFPFFTGPCATEIFRRHHAFVQRLEAGDAEPLWTETTALQLITELVAAALARHHMPPQPRRQQTLTDHAERVEAARNFLASRLGERLVLEEVAQAAQVSSFHLARIFQAQMGMPVHQYLLELRLRTALERLAAGANDLTALALDLGFSNHSHFTTTFRRAFACTPKEARGASQRKLRETSKNLKV